MKITGTRKAKSIKRTLLFGMVGLTVTVSILCGVVTGTLLYQNSNSNMKDEVSVASKGYSLALQNKIQQYKLAIEQIAADDSITDPDLTADNLKSEKDRLATKNGFLTVSTADASGKSDIAGINISEREYFKQAITGVTYISSPVVSKKDQSTALYIAAKISNSTGYNGIVFASLSSDTFSSMVDDATIGQTGYSFILDKTGTIIAHKDRNVVSSLTNYLEKVKKDSSFASAANVVKNMIARKTGGQTYTMNGSESYVAYCPIKGTDGWSIGVTAKTSEMMGSFYTSIYVTLGLMILFILLSLFIAVKIANPIANPIARLVQRIEKLSDGDLHSEVPEIDSEDEIGILSKSFGATVHTLNSYVSEISSVLGSLAAGDATVEVHQDYKGDFVEMKRALNTIITNLNGMFVNISRSTDQVASGADQVSSASQALSQGATEQASAIEELSASITEVAAEVNRNATNAANANKLSREASTEVERGNQQMQQMVVAMTDISESSKQIEKIIKAIEDIAFQTNILALNAAVEAARAGEAGKGFAVVADEVRNLAGKSAQAAKNTTVLIEGSIKAVENGTKIADETAKSLHVIIDTVKKTTDLIGEISVSSNGQATSINEITQGVDQISAVVQTNSATSEESAATSEELSGQAQILKNTLAFLKLKDVDTVTESIESPDFMNENSFEVSSFHDQEPSKY